MNDIFHSTYLKTKKRHKYIVLNFVLLWVNYSTLSNQLNHVLLTCELIFFLITLAYLHAYYRFTNLT